MEFSELIQLRFGEHPEPGLLRTFAIALAIGLLIGLERERHAEPIAGLRTFALTGLLGAVSAMLSEMYGFPWLLATGLFAVGAMTVVAHVHDRAAQADPGTTTTVAIMLCFALGAMVWRGYAEAAAPLAIVTTALLYFKPELKGITEGLGRRDLVSILQFGALSLIILPVVPDQGYGPHGALNPHRIWLMVVLISGVSLAGYLALRVVGPRHGAPLVGLLGGLVSSTATTLMYAREARDTGDDPRVPALVVLLACSVVFGRLAVLCVATAPALLPALWPLLVAGAFPLLVAAALAWRGMRTQDLPPVPDVRNPTELRTSLSFGALYALVLLLAAILSAELGAGGLYALAAVSGLTDVDAIALSGMQLLGLDQIGTAEAVTVIGLAALSNTVLKAATAVAIGGRALGRRILGGFAGSAAALVAAIAWTQATLAP
ncbi:MgtC/SapB family protein [Burkholderiaceae bacterium FT117]|uniref:MgtC/SapB family protein n=1 Tax=Zeimonas sediminis TaxID=2944268 RepID=UPI00234320B1|nr:MgtC/SapB family protein [Zeimonas sediminis]MCM5571917.1 MgtC/SapB family protein [Zeimonas sediminis]